MANFSKPQNMVSIVFALFALLRFTTALGHGAHHHKRHSEHPLKAQLDEVNDALSKRQNAPFGPRIAINGVCSTGTQWWGDCDQNGRQSYPRLEIRQLQQNADQWNLYLLGMERFVNKDKGDRLSYYQIAGIHGRPFVTWNGFPTPLMNQAGFCPHAQTLFGPWHRPYLAAYEQAWYLSVTEVINDFPQDQRQRWLNAAATLRMPYWDWAMDPGDGPNVPRSIRDQRVTVTKPQGQVTIDNPLYSYSWGDSLPDEMGGGPWNNWPRTLRRPVPDPTRSNNNEMEGRFQTLQISLRDRVFALFSSKQSWGYATTEQIGVRTDLSGSGVDSFESVHDVIHNTAGGDSGGHMYYLDVSAFDPIFWLHHTNVDRLINMYQYIVPDTYVADGNINRPMAQWNAGEPKNGNTPLKPFTKSTYGEYWTSNDVRETRVLGYYYPETSDRSYQQVARAVTQLYGAGVRSISKRSTSVNRKTGQYLGEPFKEGDYHHVLTVTANKFAVAGSYTVHCFIGNDGNMSTNTTAPYPAGNSTSVHAPSSIASAAPAPSIVPQEPEDDYNPAHDFTHSPDYVGAYGILGGMKASGANSTYLMTRGSLPLTSALQGKIQAGHLESLKPEHVESYLQKNLYLKVLGPVGEIDIKTIPNFHISVGCTKVIPASSPDSLPDLSQPYRTLSKVTENLPAGKPYVYTPGPHDVLAPGADFGEANGSGAPYPATLLPWQEQGYCAARQTVKYVYPDGRPVVGGSH